MRRVALTLITMKKVLLVAASFLLAASVSVCARDYQKNIYGVRAGLNVTTASVKSRPLTLDTKARAGLFVGGVYQRLLTEKLPVYLETGLDISQYGTTIDVGSTLGDMLGEMKTKCGIWYLQLPVMVNYKFFVRDFTLYPSLGFVYSLGLGGTAKMVSGDEVVKEDIFGDNGMFKRSDFGMRVALNGEWKRIYAGLSYGFGFLNLAQAQENANTTVRNNCTFTISVGYNF